MKGKNMMPEEKCKIAEADGFVEDLTSDDEEEIFKPLTYGSDAMYGNAWDIWCRIMTKSMYDSKFLPSRPITD